jgi:hypothetical protein
LRELSAISTENIMTISGHSGSGGRSSNANRSGGSSDRTSVPLGNHDPLGNDDSVHRQTSGTQNTSDPSAHLISGMLYCAIANGIVAAVTAIYPSFVNMGILAGVILALCSATMNYHVNMDSVTKRELKRELQAIRDDMEKGFKHMEETHVTKEELQVIRDDMNAGFQGIHDAIATLINNLP